MLKEKTLEIRFTNINELTKIEICPNCRQEIKVTQEKVKISLEEEEEENNFFYENEEYITKVFNNCTCNPPVFLDIYVDYFD